MRIMQGPSLSLLHRILRMVTGRFVYSVICLMAFGLAGYPARLVGADDIDSPAQTVLDRYLEILDREAAPDSTLVRSWYGSLSSDGSWPDIDYLSQQKTSWPARGHLDRIIAMLRSVRLEDSSSAQLAGYFC